ncbi:hypothetical protein [Haloferax sp. YSSS75]|uniref:hypothetical protein n=1 Tax=Haloferax sp. YSSS75 TaxID=3388564 RepID=UPI00398C9516
MHLDDLRESWLFLLLEIGETDHAEIQTSVETEYWEIGIGNADALVETKAALVGRNGLQSTDELVGQLLNQIGQYRYGGIVLITPDRDTLAKLRQVLVDPAKQNSLRGFRHLALEEQLECYFDQSLDDYGFGRESRSPPRRIEGGTSGVVSAGTAELFWRIWSQIFRLIPSAELVGDPL